MKLYTKRGDAGETTLAGGKPVSKCDPRVLAYGAIDETNAAIGVAIARGADEPTANQLRQIQADLFALGSQLATPPGSKAAATIEERQAVQLETWIDEASAETESLKNFILPGGVEAAASLHLARAVCRRAECAIVALHAAQPVDQWVLVYINRLSDLLFALARVANHRSGVADVRWPLDRA